VNGQDEEIWEPIEDNVPEPGEWTESEYPNPEIGMKC